jgi:uncharacterized RDD family membrane protein YckC
MTQPVHLGRRTVIRSGRWARVGAAIIDGLVLAPLTITAAVTRDPGFQVVAILAAAAYHEFCIARWGQTVGKWAVGIRVVRHADGGPPDIKAAALRWLPFFTMSCIAMVLPELDTLFGLVTFAIFVPVLVRVDGRGLHDMLSGTIVVKV